jgi:hypothetical protein
MELMEMWCREKIAVDGNCPTVGALCSPLLTVEIPELSLISYVEPIAKYLAFEPYSQGKITTLRCENQYEVLIWIMIAQT